MTLGDAPKQPASLPPGQTRELVGSICAEIFWVFPRGRRVCPRETLAPFPGPGRGAMVASGDGRVAPMASSSSHGTSQNPGGGSVYVAALAAPPGAWTISRQEVGGQ